MNIRHAVQNAVSVGTAYNGRAAERIRKKVAVVISSDEDSGVCVIGDVSMHFCFYVLNLMSKDL